MKEFFKGFANVYTSAFSYVFDLAKGTIDSWPEKNWYNYGSLVACLVFILALLVL